MHRHDTLRFRLAYYVAIFVLFFVCISPAQDESCSNLKTQTTEESPTLLQACQLAQNFRKRLPNFVCTESSKSFKQTLQQHVITAELGFEDGREKYDSILVDGRVVTTMSEVPGSWSTGEFGSNLAVLFDPRSATEFRFKKQAKLRGRQVFVYDFTLPKKGNSIWHLQLPGRSILPGFTGHIFVEATSGRVLRVEFQAAQFDESSGLESYRKRIDYAEVKLGDSPPYLLPIAAEQEICSKPEGCFRNEIRFTNYRKFRSEARILP
jgi:hypothetical protein